LTDTYSIQKNYSFTLNAPFAILEVKLSSCSNPSSHRFADALYSIGKNNFRFTKGIRERPSRLAQNKKQRPPNLIETFH
jgi:hypothetical protein